jgi:hypothetical protein
MNLTISRLAGRGRVIATTAIACAAIGAPAVALAASSAHSGPAVKACRASQTYVWFALAPNGAAGTIYYPIEFTNTGAPCTLRGFPGVAAVGKTGHQLGKPAGRFSMAVHTVTLKHNQTAHALVGIEEASIIGGCHLATGDGLQVFPPNQKQKQVTGAFVFAACTNRVFMHVYPVQPGIGVP